LKENAPPPLPGVARFAQKPASLRQHDRHRLHRFAG
jgi:hypothetical protein